MEKAQDIIKSKFECEYGCERLRETDRQRKRDRERQTDRGRERERD